MDELLSILKRDHSSASARASETGRTGEDLAARFLVENGYRLILANFKVPIGRNRMGVQVTGEIDLIALDDDVLCFVEVKTRKSEEFSPVLSAVDLRKQRQITRTARVYRQIFGIRDMSCRYNVVTVLMPKNTSSEIGLIKGFWSEAKFRKRVWNYDIS